MGNKMKKLICALLASTMLVSSVGMIAFADEDTTSDNKTEVTATAAPDATDAPEAEATKAPEAEATQAPAPEATKAPTIGTSSVYDTDNYYQKALAMCSALGIISGYEDGSVKPDSKVTRAEMASIVLRLLNMGTTAKYNNGFKDVTADHWAADQIQTAQEAGIINGMGDGTFVPDGDVTYAQIVVMILNAMNYQYDAEYYGTGSHWASGYMKVAAQSNVNLLKNAPGELDVASDRGVVIKMVYNALLGDYKEIDGTENGYPVYKAKRTLSEAKFDLIEGKGTLTATSKTALSGSELQENQIRVQDKEGKSVVYDCALTGLEEYLSQNITYYYKENRGSTSEVLAVTYDASNSENVEYDADKIESVTGFDEGNGIIKIEGVTKKKDCSEAQIIYNGKAVTAEDYLEAKAASSGDAVRFGEDFNEFLTPEVGKIRFVDDGKDGKYDVVFIDSYETMVVTNASEERLQGKVSAATDTDTIKEVKTISIDLNDDEERTINVDRNGTAVKLRNLKKNDVASIKRSLDNTVVDIVVTGESITGSATGMSQRYNESTVTVSGTKYDVANVAVADLRTGSQSIFYFDMFDRIAYVESSTAGRLQTGEKYGWLLRSYTEDNGKYYVEIISEDGSTKGFETDTRLDYWAPKTTEPETVSSAAKVQETIDTLLSDNTNFETVNDATPSKQNPNPLPVKLVKYKVNSSNKLTRLYCAVSKSTLKKAGIDLDNSNAVIVDTTSKKGSTLVGGMTGGYTIVDDGLQVEVPDAVADMSDAENYKMAKIVASVYNVRESGPAFDYLVAEMTGTTPAIIIKYAANPNNAVNVGDMDTAANNPAMIVDEIALGVDDEDNTVYTISGYSGGAEVSITTNSTSAFAEITGYSSRKYTVNKLWNAKGTDKFKDLRDTLKKGDIIIYEGGTSILRYASAEDMYKTEYVDGKEYGKNIKKITTTETRNFFYFNQVGESELGDTTWMYIGDDIVSFDPTKLMDTVVINTKTGKVEIDTEGSTISDLQEFDAETKTGDYAFARFASKGALQEIFIFRFEE